MRQHSHLDKKWFQGPQGQEKGHRHLAINRPGLMEVISKPIFGVLLINQGA